MFCTCALQRSFNRCAIVFCSVLQRYGYHAIPIRYKAEDALKEGVINEEEADLLRRTEAGRLRTINVDDFDHEELIANQAVKKPSRKKTGKAA